MMAGFLKQTCFVLACRCYRMKGSALATLLALHTITGTVLASFLLIGMDHYSIEDRLTLIFTGYAVVFPIVLFLWESLSIGEELEAGDGFHIRRSSHPSAFVLADLLIAIAFCSLSVLATSILSVGAANVILGRRTIRVSQVLCPLEVLLLFESPVLAGQAALLLRKRRIASLLCAAIASILAIVASGIPLNSVTAWIVPMWPYYAATGFLPGTVLPWGRLGMTAAAVSCLLTIWAARAFRKSR